MVNDDSRVGFADGSQASFTKYVEKREFKEFCDTVEVALWGVDKRNGLVADVNGLKTHLKIGLALIGFIAGVVAPVITFALIKYLGG